MQTKRKHDEIEAMYRDGSTTKEIADRFGITPRGLNSRIAEQNNAYRVWANGRQDIINLAEWIYEDARDRFFVNSVK